jgi:hypothetical protein
MRPKPIAGAQHQKRLCARWQAGVSICVKAAQNLKAVLRSAGGNIR